MKTLDNYKLYLDDIRTPDCMDWIIVRNYDEFVQTIIENGLPVFVSLDHDLCGIQGIIEGTIEKTGYDCARWLLDYCMKNKAAFPEYMIHSMNPVGRDNIQYLINAYKIHLVQ